jgi:hypothetical protein
MKDAPSALSLLRASLPATFPRLLHRFLRFLPSSSHVATDYKRPPPRDMATTAIGIIPFTFISTYLITS